MVIIVWEVAPWFARKLFAFNSFIVYLVQRSLNITILETSRFPTSLRSYVCRWIWRFHTRVISEWGIDFWSHNLYHWMFLAEPVNPLRCLQFYSCVSTKHWWSLEWGKVDKGFVWMVFITAMALRKIICDSGTPLLISKDIRYNIHCRISC